MTAPGLLSNAVPEDGLAAVWAELRQLRELVQQQQTAKVGNRMVVDGPPGIVVSGGGGITVDDDGNITLNGGDLIVVGGNILSGNYDPGAAGFRLRSSGNIELNSATFREGIVNDDALENPIRAKAGHAQSAGWAVTNTDTDVVSKEIIVPAGFTQAVVSASISATGVNHSGGVDFFAGYASIDVSGAFGGFDAACDGANGRAIGIAHTAGAVGVGLSGSFWCYGTVLCGDAGGWSADAFNAINLDVTALFLR